MSNTRSAYILRDIVNNLMKKMKPGGQGCFLHCGPFVQRSTNIYVFAWCQVYTFLHTASLAVFSPTWE